jgi:hypothetical protein
MDWIYPKEFTKFNNHRQRATHMVSALTRRLNLINLKQIKMEKKNFHRTITVNASAEEAMKKIAQVNLWWAKNFKGMAEKPGDTFTVRFGETFVDFQISELVPNKKVVWKVAAICIGSITKKNGITRKWFLKFRKKGIPRKLISRTLASCRVWNVTMIVMPDGPGTSQTAW